MGFPNRSIKIDRLVRVTDSTNHNRQLWSLFDEASSMIIIRRQLTAFPLFQSRRMPQGVEHAEPSSRSIRWQNSGHCLLNSDYSLHSLGRKPDRWPRSVRSFADRLDDRNLNFQISTLKAVGTCNLLESRGSNSSDIIKSANARKHSKKFFPLLKFPDQFD